MSWEGGSSAAGDGRLCVDDGKEVRVLERRADVLVVGREK